MKKYKNILSLISLGTMFSTVNPASAFVFGENQENEVQASFGYYSEKDRINVFKSVLDYKRILDTNKDISFRFSVDSLTGASPNGAIASSSQQTFSSPSGNSPTYSNPNEQPKDEFEDTRFAFSTNYSHQYSSIFKYNLGGAISSESDYLSLSVNSGLMLDLNNKNTTLSFLNSFAYDTISAEGDLPIPYSYMNNPVCEAKHNNTRDSDHHCNTTITPSIPNTVTKTNQQEHKETGDIILGLTQIINKYSLIQFNYFTSDYQDCYSWYYKYIYWFI